MSVVGANRTSSDVRYPVADGVPAQPVDATQALNLSAGVSNCNVSRGRDYIPISMPQRRWAWTCRRTILAFADEVIEWARRLLVLAQISGSKSGSALHGDGSHGGGFGRYLRNRV